MVQYWRAAGMTYLTYSVKCADLVRQALKEPFRSQVLNRIEYSMVKGSWEGGKITERSKFAPLKLAIVNFVTDVPSNETNADIPCFSFSATLEPNANGSITAK